MKKLFTLFWALVASSALWAADFTIYGIAYNKLGGDSVEVTSGDSYSGSVTIPSTVKYSSTTYRVTSIGDSAFWGCDSLSSVTIPNSVTSIGKEAFYWCDSLTSVTIPNSVTSIGERAFAYCDSLISITIGNSVTNIGWWAFGGCSSLSSITCYATTPPICGVVCFFDVTKSIPLYVPEGSIDAYKAAEWWKDFTNIQAITTDIKNVNANVNENANRKVMKNGKVVIIKNGCSYTLTGTPIK